jgi:Bifunctional DNA primase/polymerase, N-terminal
MYFNSMSASDMSLLDAALALANAGYPVIPLKPREKRRRTRRGTQPSNDPAVVREWWRRMPDSSIGVVLDDVLVVVIDVDGPEGRASLAWLLAQAGLDDLPDTYTVTTGRPDGGHHYWYRLPPEAVKLVNQVGHPTTPQLDILFQGLAVGAGSVHKSGALYQGSPTDMPQPSALTELPMALYQVLAQRGRPKVAEAASSAPQQRRPAALVPRRSGVAVSVDQGGLPRHVKNWLADSTDGRNGRTYRTVLAMVRLGLDDQHIIDVVIASPLGSKALQQANPHAWVQDKIDDARAYIPLVLDREAFWQAVHTSGMPPGQMRILDTLLGRASVGGYVSISQDWMAIDSAVAKTSGAVHTLITKGWLIVVEPWTFDRPASYRLASPVVGSDEKYPPQVCPPPPPLSSNMVSGGNFSYVMMHFDVGRVPCTPPIHC